MPLRWGGFLFDKTHKPYISSPDLAKEFGLSQSTIRNKSKQIRDMLKMHRANHHWCLPSKLKDNPFVWMITFNGFIIDARTLAPKIQEVAYEKDLIPYVHAYERQK